MADNPSGVEGTGTFLYPGEKPGDLTHPEMRKRIKRHYQEIWGAYQPNVEAGRAALRRIKAELEASQS